MIDGTAILRGRASGRRSCGCRGPGGAEGQRIFLAGASLGCPGPVIHCDLTERPGAPSQAPGRSAPTARPSGDSRDRGSPASSARPTRRRRRHARSNGAETSTCSPAGRASSPRAERPKTTIVVDDLAQARSTWNATEQGSQWILSDWPLSGDPAAGGGRRWQPFLPGRNALMAVPARPGVGLFPKTFDAYADPIIPEPTAIGGATARPAVPATAAIPRRPSATGPESRRCRRRAQPLPGVAGGGRDRLLPARRGTDPAHLGPSMGRRPRRVPARLDVPHARMCGSW